MSDVLHQQTSRRRAAALATAVVLGGFTTGALAIWIANHHPGWLLVAVVAFFSVVFWTGFYVNFREGWDD